MHKKQNIRLVLIYQTTIPNFLPSKGIQLKKINSLFVFLNKKNLDLLLEYF